MGTPENGGARRDRTVDLLHAMQALSQLSYGPLQRGRIVRKLPRAVNGLRAAARRSTIVWAPLTQSGVVATDKQSDDRRRMPE
jgi:hypothetical protein